MPSLLEALERKYFENGNDSEEEDMDLTIGTPPVSIFIPRLPPLLCVPELLVLNDCDIDHAGDCEIIKEKCRRVRELDLTQNKLNDWQEIFGILQHMPRIEFLNLSRNLLNGTTPLTRTLDPAPAAISNLRSLVLNGTLLDWLCVDVLLANLPILEELHLSLNEYEEVLIDTCCCSDSGDMDTSEECCNANDYCNRHADVEADVDADANNAIIACCKPLRCRKIAPHRALKTLHFTGNPIENWSEICRLGRCFPSLENLVLADCPIKSLNITDETTVPVVENIAPTATSSSSPSSPSSPTSDDTPFRHFRNVKLLNLSCANITTWDDIDQLAKFPQLRNLRVKNWPLWDRVECTEHERRQLLIARLPNVTILNGGGRISDDEREDAERAFIRRYMDKPANERPQRYAELVACHGQLEPLVNINLKPDKHITVLITYKEHTQARLVDIYRSVADLKVKLEKVLGVPANKMRLYYLDKDCKDMGGPEIMRFPNKLLYSYNLQAGDEIIVDEKQ